MIVMDERFLINAGSKYGIGASLPLRLQKRALLRVLGFPVDPNLNGCKSCETDKVTRYFREYSVREYPFLIIVSEKPMSSLVPPLFVVRDTNGVQWRNNQGVKQIITADNTLSIIKDYPQSTWVEFSPYPWGGRTIAGRLIYIDLDHQVLEMQQGTTPANLINNRRLPTYVGDLSFLDLERHCYIENSRSLRAIGFPTLCSLSVVRGICRKMPSLTSFERLRYISQFPTLEFAVTGMGQLIAIDIDWPAQWAEQKKGNS